MALFWLGFWEILALVVGQEILLPSPLTVIEVLLTELITKSFWLSVGASFLRVLIGFAAAVIGGAIFGFITAKISFLRTLFAPLLHVVRAAPVASFIILALIWIQTDLLPAFISFLMGFPIVWNAVQDAVMQGDPEREEAAKVFRLGVRKTFRYVTVPAVFPAFVTSSVTCLGFCWKSAVAAEVICRPLHAIGSDLERAKMLLESPHVFAYTAVTVLLSLLLERLFRLLLKFAEQEEPSHADHR